MNSIIYEMSEFSNQIDLLKDSLLIIAIDNEERSHYALKEFAATNSIGRSAIVFDYNSIIGEETIHVLESIVQRDSIQVIRGFPKSQIEFVEQIRNSQLLKDAKKIVIDISCILTPYLFLLIKCIIMWNTDVEIFAINTLPFDYAFSESPFTSYRSFYGDLKMEEILGYSSSKELNQESDLFIFAGFERALALKVKEDTEYNNLFFVNALPSYHQKYKDISILNNYQLLLSEQCKRLYTPAINPFEVYNLLDKHIASDRSVCIAPLSTKPIALGICLYALNHDNVRIIYPFSDKYESEKSHEVYKSYVYNVILSP